MKVARKVMVNIKFDAREPPEAGLVETLSGSLYWWVELGVPSQHMRVEQSNDKIFRIA